MGKMMWAGIPRAAAAPGAGGDGRSEILNETTW